MNLVKIISTEFDSLKRRLPKFQRKGLYDIQTALEGSPFGIDSNPIKDMIAIYGITEQKGDCVIIGYINKNQLADTGETRFFSTDENGVLQTYVWLKNDGTISIGGDSDNMVRYSELKSGFDQLKTDLNNLITSYNLHTHVLALTSGTGTAAPTVSQGVSSTADISNAKIDEIKTL